MKHTATTRFGPCILECPDSPHYRYVVASLRLGKPTRYYHELANGQRFWHRTAEYDGEQTAYCDTRKKAEVLFCEVHKEAEDLLRGITFFNTRTAQKQELVELPQAA